MRISLLQISLLRFFKTFQKYLDNAFWGLFISLMRFFGQSSQNIAVMKIALVGEYLANTTFSQAPKLQWARSLCIFKQFRFGFLASDEQWHMVEYI